MPCPNEEGLEQELCAALEESLGSAHGFDSDGFEYESMTPPPFPFSLGCSLESQKITSQLAEFL